MARWFDPYETWLGIPAREQPPHYYRLLGLELFESDWDAIETAVTERTALLRTQQAGRYAECAQDVLAEINAARLCLLAPDRKAAYDAELGQHFAKAEEDRAARRLRRGWLAVGGLTSLAAGLAIAIGGYRERLAPKKVAPGRAVAVAAKLAAEEPRPKLSAEVETRPAQPVAKAKPQDPSPKPEVAVKPNAKSAPPVLLKPAQGAVLPNGTRDRSKAPVWEFQWAPVEGAKKYELQVQSGRGKKGPIEVSDLTAPTYRLTSKRFVPHQALKNWHWRVRAMVDGEWTDWTEHTFDVAPAEAVPPAKPKEKPEPKAEPPAETAAEALAKKAAALAETARSAHTLPAHRSVAEQAVALGREALQKNQFSTAAELSKLAQVAAAKARDKDTIASARSLAKEVQEAGRAEKEKP